MNSSNFSPPTCRGRRRTRSSELIEKYVARVEIKAKRIAIVLKASAKKTLTEISWLSQKKRDLVRIDGDHIVTPAGGPNPQLVQAIVRAHAWLTLLTNGTYDSIEALARAIDLHPKVIRSRIRLVFLAPSVTRAFLGVPQPSLKDVNDLAASIELGWSSQLNQFIRPTHA